ncbi:MAG TPA: transcriptional regulator [Ignavibacteriales bacterium]|nr:transcriptional regulator [Ignavibacteriales bacterium]
MQIFAYEHMTTENKIEKFKALSDETRLRIINLLLVNDSLCVCELVDTLEIPQYQISKGLAILKSSGIVELEKDGKWGYYQLSKLNETNKSLFLLLKKILNDEIFINDLKKLNDRLLLREEGRCVVGFVVEKDLLMLIKKKKEEVNA